MALGSLSLTLSVFLGILLLSVQLYQTPCFSFFFPFCHFLLFLFFGCTSTYLLGCLVQSWHAYCISTFIMLEHTSIGHALPHTFYYIIVQVALSCNGCLLDVEHENMLAACGSTLFGNQKLKLVVS